MTTRTAVIWFRRDLRLHDHPALVGAAAGADRVVPLFVVDLRLLSGRFASPNRTWFLLESVRGLRDSLRAIGSDLVVRVGDPREVVPAVAGEVGATDLFVSRDHAPYGRVRDGVVAAALAATGVAWRSRRGVLVHEPDAVLTRDGRPFGVYGPFRRAWEALERRPMLDAPTDLGPSPATVIEPGAIPTLADVVPGGVPTAHPSELPEPGEAAARGRLDRWLTLGIDAYAEGRDRLDRADGTSRLSADLRFGLLSPLEVIERAAGDGEGRRVFRNELVWREFYAHVLFHRPDVRRAAFRSAFDGVDWADDPAGLAAWREGRTGYPMVDAAMRQLAATGWLPNRARMIAASFLTKDLFIDWRTGEAWFMRHLVDGDVASNNGGWQWTASTGTDPQPWFRIFNPVTQGRRHDPDGRYARRWVPELAAVPLERLHAPWTMDDDEQAAASCRIGRDYPAPIVDHGAARERALAAYAAAARDGSGRRRTS